MALDETALQLEELLSYSGAENFSDEARALAERYKSLQYLFQIDEYKLTEEKLCSDNSAHFLRLAAGLTSRRITDRYKFGKKYLQKEIEEYICGLFFGATVETLYMLLFDDANRLMGCEYLGDGTVNSFGILPRKLIDFALRKKSKRIILAHNHPCGESSPSCEDLAVTTFLAVALKNADIELMAHYVVTGFCIKKCSEIVG